MNVQVPKRKSNGPAARLFFGQGWHLVCAGLLLLAGLGCASGHRKHRGSDGIEVAETTVPPTFLTGPSGVLLTNTEQFSARVVLTTAADEAPDHRPLCTGNLFHQFGQLLFIPMKDGGLAAGAQKRSFRFLWDESRNSGYVICEALRGYARASGAARYSIGEPSESSILEQVDGQECKRQEIQVRSNEGQNYQVTVWRATELNGVPIRMAWASGGQTLILKLAEVVVEAQTPELFDPPSAFVEYDRAQSMVRELVRRPHPLPYSGSHERQYR